MSPTSRPTALVPAWRPGDAPVGLYVHVPFCRALCTYCAFAKGLYDRAQADRWLRGLEQEAARRAETAWTGRPVLDTLFLGGGTPSALAAGQWRRLGELLHERFVFAPGLEFTSEANPESLTPEIAAAMREIGVNRLSLGVQSLEPGELALLGRIHGAVQVTRAVGIAREAGFDNLNLDLMYALPGQEIGTFRDTLDGVLTLGPDHLSAYCLGLEPGTELARRVGAAELPAPEDETARDLYEHLVARTAGAGYGLYEISNFARPGRACRHNLRYWRRRDVIGLGPSAHALLGGRRWVNPAPLEGWIDAYATGPGPAPRAVPAAVGRFEWVFLHLRLAEGLDTRDFAAAWGEPFDTVYGPVARPLVEAGLLVRDGDRLALAPDARFVSDAVFAEFAPGR